MYPIDTGITVVLNIVYLLIDLAGVASEAVTNIPVCSMAIAPLSSALMLPETMDQCSSDVVHLDVESKLIERVISTCDVCFPLLSQEPYISSQKV
jgi:hypothetical protein